MAAIPLYINESGNSDYRYQTISISYANYGFMAFIEAVLCYVLFIKL